ncbi:MAG: hypothetical protein Q8M94_13170, partial [Ignavibacteria bacterium]|nr:hypothetical protein [Ignavibacteria bacterium]
SDLKQPRIEKAIVLIGDGKTEKDACAEAGISVWTLKRALKHGGEHIDQILAIRSQALQEDYVKVATARRILIERLVEEAEKDELNMGDMLALEARMGTLEEKFEKQVHVLSPEINDAAKYLKEITGPLLRRGKAVITQMRLEISDASPIIDGEFSDSGS